MIDLESLSKISNRPDLKKRQAEIDRQHIRERQNEIEFQKAIHDLENRLKQAAIEGKRRLSVAHFQHLLLDKKMFQENWRV